MDRQRAETRLEDLPDYIAKEGWMEKKGGSRRNWNRRYFVLQGPFLYYYNSDAAFKKKQKHKGMVSLKDCVTQMVEHKSRKHCFEIGHADSDRRDFTLDCASQEELYEWIEAISTAAVGPVNAPITVDSLYETLGLDNTATKKELTKAYRKMALKNHPDRGGDLDVFKSITEAYEILCSVKETEVEETENFEEFTVTLERGKIGLGLSLEDCGNPPLNRIIVTGLIEGKPAAACGQIAEDDILIQVDKHGIRGIPFDNVLKYLKGFGNPQITLKFLRRKGEKEEFDIHGAGIRKSMSENMPSFNPNMMPAPADANMGRRVSTIRQSVAQNAGRRPSSWIEMSEAEERVNHAAEGSLEGMDFAPAPFVPAPVLESVNEDGGIPPPAPVPTPQPSAAQESAAPPANADIDWFRRNYAVAQKEITRLRKALQESQAAQAETIEWQQQREKALSLELQAALGGNAAQKYNDYVGALGADAARNMMKTPPASLHENGGRPGRPAPGAPDAGDWEWDKLPVELEQQFRPKDLQRLKAAFREFDVNGDGHIGVEEMEHMLRKLKIAVDVDAGDGGDAYIRQLMLEQDDNGNGQIEFVEFVAIMLKVRNGKTNTLGRAVDKAMAQAYGQRGGKGNGYDDVKHRASTMHLGVGQASGVNAASTVNFASRLRSNSTHGIKSVAGRNNFGATSKWNSSPGKGSSSKWNSSTRTNGVSNNGVSSATVSGRTPSPTRARPAPASSRLAATTGGSRRPQQAQRAADGAQSATPMVSNDFISRIEKIKAMKRGSGTGAAPASGGMTSTFSDARSKLAQRAQQAGANRNYPAV